MAADPKDGVAPAAGDAIAVACPCGKTATVKAEHAGKKVKCGRCQRVLVVPTPPPAESLSSSDPQLNTIDEVPKSDKDLWSFLAPAQAKDEIGRLGPYRVVKVLGHGGMGVVFKAEDPALKRFVALKAMLPSAAQSASAKERFLREARTAAALKHDHIVSIFQVGEDRGVPYLAMEFLEGESLDDCLKREGRLPVSDVLRIGIEIADGLAAAHDQGLIHRDIKPGNIWMETRTTRRKDAASISGSGSGLAPRAKILDFGLARPDDDTHLTRTGMIVGTPAYMPPEQARGLKVDGRCDLYSLGVVVYKMVTGEVPYKGKDTMSILAALALDTPIEPWMLNKDIPTRLNDLIMKLLSKDANDRPATALDVMASLEAIGADPSGLLPEPDFEAMVSRAVSKAGSKKTPPETARLDGRTPKTSLKPRLPGRRRWPLVAIAGGGVALLAVLCGLVLLWPTPHGTVRIETDDPNVEIVFDKTGPTIKGASKEPIHLQPGPHGLLVKRGDFEFQADQITIRDGQTVTLRVELIRDKLQLVRDGKVLASKKLPPPVEKNDPQIAKVDPPRKTDPPVVKADPKPVDPPTVKPVPVPAAVKAGEEMTNSIGMKLVSIPPGKFLMGSPPDEKERGANEVQHDVEITKGFWLGKYEVTQEEYEKVMGNNPSNTKGPKLPVENVSWEDAKEFCKKLSAKEGKDYTLPTEAEWEYACRAGTKGPFSTGRSLAADQANYNGDFPYVDYAKGPNRERTTPVGSFLENDFGLCDMHGNVWEWCEDWLGDYDAKVLAVDPKGASGGSDRVLRGGCLSSYAGHCRSASRYGLGPSFRHVLLGFRVALRSVKTPNQGVKVDPPMINPAPVPAPVPAAVKAGEEMTNSIGMKLVSIPPGKFLMGSPPDEKERLDSEVQHEVEITKGFWLGKYEVTQEEYEKVMGSNPSKTRSPKLPVECVSWEDAKEFCKKLSAKEGKEYTLPTEAEWEYACRAGTKGPFSTGENLTPAQANYNGQFPYTGNAKGEFRGKTTEVGSFPANALGLCDMHGNVWEWCEDQVGNYDANVLSVNPKGASGGSHRVIRGGSWDNYAGNCRSAFRRGREPSGRGSYLGFRVALRSVK